MVEVNEYIYGFLWITFLFETMILVGVLDNKRQKKEGRRFLNFKLNDLLLLIPACLMIIIGFFILVFSSFEDSIYSLGFAFVVFGSMIMIFFIQERGSGNILARIDELDVPRKKV
jgi:uncharacterized membrane protein YiaA